MMTKKHYIEVAKIIKDHTSYDDNLIPADIACDLAIVFAQDNPRFDRIKFLEACGV